MKECKLPIGVGVSCGPASESKQVVDYLKECGIPNPDLFNGTDSHVNYGRSNLDRIAINKSDYKSIITFEEFHRMINEQVIENYSVF